MLEDEIKSALAQNNILIGTRSVVRALKTSKLKLVIMANNTPERIKSDLQHYAKIANVPVQTFNGTGKEFGIFLGKPFAVTVIAIK